MHEVQEVAPKVDLPGDAGGQAGHQHDGESLRGLFSLALDHNSRVPIYRQLSDGLRESILKLSLMPGQMLPSTRELSRSLGVSRATVLRCYEELLSQGYLKSVEGIGTFVCDKPPLQQGFERNNAASTPLRLSNYAKWITDLDVDAMDCSGWEELNFGASPPDLLPRKFWRQILLKNCRSMKIDIDHYEVAPLGYQSLREAVANYVARSRAVRCTAGQIAVFMGSSYGVNLIARLFIDEGDVVAVENPGFIYARQVFLTHNARVCPIPVDDDGIVVSELKRLAPDCKLVYLTPSHNDPTGAVLSLDRRLELLAWAKETGTLIVEDDYGGEFRYGSLQLPSLQGLDDGDVVIYQSSFWKTLFPLVNIGYMILPRTLVKTVWKAQLYVRDNNLNTGFPALEHTALTEFLEEGYLDRHVRKLNSIYAERCHILVTELRTHLGGIVTCRKESNSMHMVATFAPRFSPETIERCARDSGFALVSTEGYYLENPPERDYMLPFAHLESDLIRRQVKRFAQLLLESAVGERPG